MKGHKDYLFVTIQLLLFIAFLFDFGIAEFELPSTVKPILLGSTVLGGLIILIALIQLNSKISPFPTPKENSSLIINGVFRWVRHPIYTGLILSFWSYSLYQESLFKLSISLALTVLFHFKVKYEEDKMTEKFPEYVEYKKKTGRLFPFL